MAEPLATVAQLGSYLQRSFPTEPGGTAGQSADAASAELALRVASGLVRAELALPALTAALVPDDVLGVVLSVAARKMDNPEQLRSETLGGYNNSRFETGASIGLHPEEKAILRRSPLGRASVYSLPFR